MTVVRDLPFLNRANFITHQFFSVYLQAKKGICYNDGYLLTSCINKHYNLERSCTYYTSIPEIL